MAGKAAGQERDPAGRPPLKVADEIAKWLAEKEIRHAFGIVGGGNVALWDAITRLGETQIVCTHHEQAAAMAACFYQRTCGKVALCLVTTGGGSSNAITGVLAGYMDRTPLLVISGNEASRYMEKPTRVWGVQGYGCVEVAGSFTKIAYRTQRPERVIKELEWLLDLASLPPGGPVWFDIPADIQRAMV